MDALADLNARLTFVRWFYCTAARPFVGLQRECVPRSELCDDDPPDDSSKWEQATKGLEVLGQCSLFLVAKAVVDYLRQFIRLEDGSMPPLQGESQFEKLENSLLTRTTFRWDACPVERGRIEQIILCRNDFTHHPDIDSPQPQQTPGHFRKHPSSPYRDALEKSVLMAVAELKGEQFRDSPGSLTVTRQGLLGAISDVRQFCAFVARQRRTSPGEAHAQPAC